MDRGKPDLEGLRRFANRADRERSPIFVAREEETKKLINRAEDIGADHAEGLDTQDRTTVISGCPGSGKSAFLSHLAEVCGRSGFDGAVVIPVRCALEDLTAQDSETLQAQVEKRAREGRGGQPGILEALLKDGAHNAKLENTFRAVAYQIKRDSGRNTVVCLLVDEIQNVDQRNRNAVHLLHTYGFSPPILPIYAGLNTSIEQLEKVCGISRPADNARMTMGPLGKDAAEEATKKLFEKYRIAADRAVQSAWSRAIDEEALGFAQHLHVTLKAACSVLLERDGIPSVKDVGRLRALARAAREDYYAGKVKGELNDHAGAMLDVVERATMSNERVTKPKLAKWMQAAMRQEDPTGTQCSEEKAEELVERMQRRGILHITDDEQAEVPVPSLHTWLMESYAEQIGWNRESPFATEPREVAGGQSMRERRPGAIEND